MLIPVLSIPRVFHIGTLLAPPIAAPRSSLEGHCLSVSLCPEAWVAIAKLGGLPVHQLTHRMGRFLDLVTARECPELRAYVTFWGTQEGLTVQRTVWQAWHYDREDDDWRYFLCATRADAEAEVAGADETEQVPDAGPLVRAITIPAGTPALQDRTGVPGLALQDVTDYLFLAWAEAQQTALHLDGVWWTETYAPEILSAPRGGIFPARVGHWTRRARVLPWGHLPPDEDLLAEMPSPVEEAVRSPR